MGAEYLLPSSIDEALDLLQRHGASSRVIAGGTDLMLQIAQGKREVGIFVDVTRIAELNGICELTNEMIWLGATTTHRQVWESSLVQARAAVLATACRSVGALQIQNVGTIGGNIVNAMPAADASIALMALSAEAEIANRQGRRWIDLEHVFSRPGECKIEPASELLVALRFRGLGMRAGSAFERLARRRALALPVLNCGVVVHLDDSGQRFESAAIALGPVAPIPYRARRAEALLAGAPVNEETIEAAAREALEESEPRSSVLRAGREYRREMVGVLTRRGLIRAVEQARQ